MEVKFSPAAIRAVRILRDVSATIDVLEDLGLQVEDGGPEDGTREHVGGNLYSAMGLATQTIMDELPDCPDPRNDEVWNAVNAVAAKIRRNTSDETIRRLLDSMVVPLVRRD